MTLASVGSVLGKTPGRAKKFTNSVVTHEAAVAQANVLIMAGIKRKSTAVAHAESKSTSKKFKVDKPAKKLSVKRGATVQKPSKKAAPKDDVDELLESDTSEEANGFYGFSADKSAASSGSTGEGSGFDSDIDGADESDSGQDATQNDKTLAGKPSTLANLNGMLIVLLA